MNSELSDKLQLFRTLNGFFYKKEPTIEENSLNKKNIIEKEPDGIIINEYFLTEELKTTSIKTMI